MGESDLGMLLKYMVDMKQAALQSNLYDPSGHGLPGDFAPN